MNRFKGPDLKVPDLKVPTALRDLYLDLRDRRLLPLMGLILVAIVATPFLLGGSSKPVRPVTRASGNAPAEEASLTVLPAAPGLREPSKRLAGRAAKNPFRPHYTAPVLNEGAAPTSETSTSTTTTTSSTTTSTAPEGGSTEDAAASPPAPEPSGGGSSSGEGGGSEGQSTNDVPPGRTLYTLAVTVAVTRIETKADGSLDKKGPTLYKEVLAPTPLPGEKTPVITYLGMGAKHHEPLFLVSNEVTAIFGEANCISGVGTCQLLVLEEGFPVTFVYGDNDVRYKINLVKAEPVVNGHS